ncbi:MAG TPA: SAM-dependent DNA methyltransferase [Ancylobacter sp.]
MTAFLPLGARAIMSSRVEPPSSLDFFPTPPWATRALCQHVLGPEIIGRCPLAFDPAAGEGHMAETLREYFPNVAAADIHDYGAGYLVADFLAHSPVIGPDGWIITNPPFNLAVEFARHALQVEDQGVALLLRTNWLEGETRFAEFLGAMPPDFWWQYTERVPMHRGRYVPGGSTATAYGWAVWMPRSRGALDTRLRWIPPSKHRLFRPEDARRWCEPTPIPLFEGGA